MNGKHASRRAACKAVIEWETQGRAATRSGGFAGIRGRHCWPVSSGHCRLSRGGVGACRVCFYGGAKAADRLLASGGLDASGALGAHRPGRRRSAKWIGGRSRRLTREESMWSDVVGGSRARLRSWRR
ncbi:uncharacterized protein A4U43_C06F17260 [Asparagus officinalis]|uniref:Uncharacterized protein n=1 Tax=Asparagus officinalis TaxID=4686 RepID=A0A5P1ENG0_ASPOF|nr:uncharacterized protein A4U43_C06F17260 [Asparagus officinalis]